MPESFEFSEPMPCYEFSRSTGGSSDDGKCVHCRKYLTVECDYIDQFLDEGDGE